MLKHKTECFFGNKVNQHKSSVSLLLHNHDLNVVINSLNLSYGGGLRYYNCHNFREDFIGAVDSSGCLQSHGIA